MLLSTVIVLVWITLTGAQKVSTGREAEIQCKAYKKVCPIGKQCAIQHLHWPRKMSFPVCISEHKIQARSRICELPPAPGGCGAQFTRWYFNVHTQTCGWFTYGGCDGNLNNFLTRSACEFACLPRTTLPLEQVTVLPLSEPEPTSELPEVRFDRESAHRPPIILAAPAPLALNYDMDFNGLNGAQEMRVVTDTIPHPLRHRNRKHRRQNKKDRDGRRRRRKNTRNSGNQENEVEVPKFQEPLFAELRVRRIPRRPVEQVQNDQAERHPRRKSTAANGSHHYKLFRLFDILEHGKDEAIPSNGHHILSHPS